MLLLRGEALGVALNGAPLLPLLLAVLHQLTPAYHDSLVYGKLAVLDDTVSHKLLLTHLLPSSDVQGDEETVAAPVVAVIAPSPTLSTPPSQPCQHISHLCLVQSLPVP